MWGWVSSLTKYFDKYIGWRFPHWLIIPGVVIMIIGGVIASLCAFNFVIFGKGTPAPFDAPKEFVCSGLYKYVRNPMYIGGLFLFVGFAFLNRSVSMFLFVFLWLIIINAVVVFYEEKTLEKHFGRTYLDYKNKVNRWLPSIKNKYSPGG